MKVQNMLSSRGNKIANQFIIDDDNGNSFFQSYNSVIVKRSSDGDVTLDKKYWDYSVTTGKYRNLFLNETKKETEAKIQSGLYALDDLNNKAA